MHVKVTFIFIITTVMFTTPVDIPICKHFDHRLKSIASLTSTRTLDLLLKVTSFLQVCYKRAIDYVLCVIREALAATLHDLGRLARSRFWITFHALQRFNWRKKIKRKMTVSGCLLNNFPPITPKQSSCWCTTGLEEPLCALRRAYVPANIPQKFDT